MIISECLPRFQNHLKVVLGFRPGTIDRYSYTLLKYEKWVLSRGVEGGIDEVTGLEGKALILDWLKDLFYHQGNIKSSSRASKLAAIKKFFAYLVYDDAIDKNEDPAVNIPSPKVAKVMPQKFSTAQLKAIFSAPDLTSYMGIRDLAILTVLYGCGPRVEEIREMGLNDLRFTGNDIYIYIQGKGAKERTVRLRRRASSNLRNWLVIREQYAAPGERALFVSFRPPCPGTNLSKVSYNKILKKYAAAVGIKNERVFVHKVRSTFATDLYDADHGLIEISMLLGHSSVETTQGYIAISEKVLKKTAISDKRWKELEGREDVQL